MPRTSRSLSPIRSKLRLARTYAAPLSPFSRTRARSSNASRSTRRTSDTSTRAHFCPRYRSPRASTRRGSTGSSSPVGWIRKAFSSFMNSVLPPQSMAAAALPMAMAS